MSRLLIALVAVILILTGCESNQIKTKEDLKTVNEQRKITETDYAQVIGIIKDKTKDNETRRVALNILITNNYKGLKNLLEEIMAEETAIKEDLIKLSLGYKDFSYNANDRIVLLQYFIDNKKYKNFFEIYNYEELKLSKEDVSEIEDQVFLNNESDVKKMYYLISKSENRELFIKFSEKNISRVFDYFIKEKRIWVIELLKNDKKVFNRYRAYITKGSYEQYKEVVYFYLENKNLGFETVAAEMILDFEPPVRNKLSEANQTLQLSAIKRYGTEESKDALEKLAESGNINVLRALSYLKSEKALEPLRKLYELEKKLTFLEYIYLIDSNESIDIFKKEFKNLNNENKSEMLNRIKNYNMNDALEIAMDDFNNAAAPDERKRSLDFIIANGFDEFTKLAPIILEGTKYSEDEKKYTISKLGEVAGEDLKEQILKSIEFKIYNVKYKKEKETVALSGKIKIWEDYLATFPESFYKDEINQKLFMYKTAIDNIKIEFSTNKEKRIMQVDDKIEEYKGFIKKETDRNSINAMREKIAKLENDKIAIANEKEVNEKERLHILENDYIKHVEKINSIAQQIYLIETAPNRYQRENEEKTLRTYFEKLNRERSEMLEKIIVLYGFYIDKYGMDDLNPEVTKDINGMK